jgi:hypothetical protein
LAALGKVQRLPVRILDGHVEECEEHRQHQPERRIQPDKLTSDLLADFSHLVALLDLKVRLEEVNDGKIQGGFAEGDCAAFQYKPAVRQTEWRNS